MTLPRGLSTRRLLGLDRSGPPPPETREGEPLNPWTIPNGIGFARLALLPVFLVSALGSGDGRTALAATLYAVVAGTDYLDGLVARLTGQYSRLGTLLDPLVDRLLVLAGIVVTWHFELLPRWALAILAARELFMLLMTRFALSRGVELNVNWLGRIGVFPTMFALWFAQVSVSWVAEAFLYLGLAFTLAATVLYVREGLQAMRDEKTPSSST